MARLLFVLTICMVLCNMYVSAAPAVLKTESRNKRTSDKIGDLREKLSKLKQMLDDIDESSAKITAAPEKIPAVKENTSGEKQKSEQGDNTLTKKDILLLKSLQSALDNIKSEEKPNKKESIPAKRTRFETMADTKHGGFENFPDNVLEKIVYRLLADLDLALKNGISVEDIIHYIYKAEQAARDRTQRNRIEDEESQLKALLNQKPGPRD